MKLFLSYLCRKRRTLVLMSVFAAVFAAVFALYRIPVAAVIYPAVICIFIGSVFLVCGYLSFRKKHDALCILKNMTAETIADLPESGDVICSDYNDIVRRLQDEISGLRSSYDERYAETVEYYTVWAHQIKTPIASMRLTLQNEDSDTARRISSDLFRIEHYVEMVLAFLRLDSSYSDYVFREHTLDDIIKPSLRRFAPEFITRRIRLEYEPLTLRTVTDEKWLSFVIEQILSNSLKYTKSGSIRIYAEGDCLCIADTGIGIEPGDLPRIFERGFTGCNGRADRNASGIGLYLCRRICKRLGVAIHAESEPGKGTTVTLDLSQKRVRHE